MNAERFTSRCSKDHDRLTAGGLHVLRPRTFTVRLTTGPTHSTAPAKIIFRYVGGAISTPMVSDWCPERCDKDASMVRHTVSGTEKPKTLGTRTRLLPIEICSSLSLTILKLQSNNLLLFQQTKRPNTQR
jgi:hypothetical protein